MLVQFTIERKNGTEMKAIDYSSRLELTEQSAANLCSYLRKEVLIEMQTRKQRDGWVLREEHDQDPRRNNQSKTKNKPEQREARDSFAEEVPSRIGHRVDRLRSLAVFRGKLRIKGCRRR